MPKNWIYVRVELGGGRDIECDPPPGRIFLVGPGHTFADLADAIDVGFARWELSHLHVFELPDGREVGVVDVGPDENDWLDHKQLKVASELELGDEFRYTFDLGDDWRHSCRVMAEKEDPIELFGEIPPGPTPVFGWGWIPDQHGRETAED